MLGNRGAALKGYPILIRILAALSLASLVATKGLFASDVSLEWDANTEPELGGYELRYGTESGNYTSTVDVGNVTTHTVTGLAAGTY